MVQLSKLELRKPPYKAEGGQWLTKGLFYESAMNYSEDIRSYPQGQEPFSLNIDRPGQVCVRKTFVELGDPTGYQWAMIYLRDYAHWQRLMESSWFKEAYEGWLLELETKTRSEAIKRLKEIAISETPQALVANKYLATLEYKKSGRGRPSKEEVAGELKKVINAAKMEDEDYQRIRLVKG